MSGNIRQEIARRYMIQCKNSKDFECPYLETCPHEDNDVCQWQLDMADEILSFVLTKLNTILGMCSERSPRWRRVVLGLEELTAELETSNDEALSTR